jgi:arabinan endo-1,5-alpha-L-arabinosidase
VDAGVVIQTTAADVYNALDPAPLLDADGRLWLVFGSYWTGIKLVELDPQTGKRFAPDAPLYHLAAAPRPKTDIEAAYLYKHKEWYYLFINRGQCCQGVRSTYEVRVGRSQTITGPYVDRAGMDLLNGGGTVFLKKHDRFIGPGHVGIMPRDGREWCSYHFYDATHNGQPTLMVEPLMWDADGWPRTINEDKQKGL